ncbi:hypothetical protein [Roseateles sp. P5_E11]
MKNWLLGSLLYAALGCIAAELTLDVEIRILADASCSVGGVKSNCREVGSVVRKLHGNRQFNASVVAPYNVNPNTVGMLMTSLHESGVGKVNLQQIADAPSSGASKASGLGK